MDAGTFKSILVKAGAMVTILRPSTSESFSVIMAGPGTIKDETLMAEARQNDEMGVFSVLDFEGQLFTEPFIGDRITDADGTTFSIEQIKKAYGLQRALYGWKCRIRG